MTNNFSMALSPCPDGRGEYDAGEGWGMNEKQHVLWSGVRIRREINLWSVNG